MLQKYAFPLVLATAFLDILWMGILIPALPFIIQWYGVGPEWVGYSMAVYSLGMFFGGLVFGRLSDKYGRKPLLMVTTLFNFLGFFFIVYAPTFLIFLAGRCIAGLGGAGFGVVQAYIADISTKENRTRRFGLIGAAFGLGFLIGPAIGGILAGLGNEFIGYAGAFVVFINFLLIAFVLPEPKKHVLVETVSVLKNRFGIPSAIILLLSISLLVTIAFSPIQGISWQYYSDRFGFGPQEFSYVLIIIGLTSIIYQGFLIPHVRKLISENILVLVALAILAVAFVFQAANMNPIFLWAFLPLFPIGMGSLQPSLGSLIAAESGNEYGKFMGLNTSIIGLWSIAGPALWGFLYVYGSSVPYYASAGIFVATILVALPLIARQKKKVAEQKESVTRAAKNSQTDAELAI